MASKTPFIYKSCPVFPGAFLVNGGGSFPIFCSTTNFSNCGMTDIDNSYIVMPGYLLIIYYDSGYRNQKDEINNSTGTTIIYKRETSENNASSCRLYFGENYTNEIILSGIS
jgi:hypothetical protein